MNEKMFSQILKDTANTNLTRVIEMEKYFNYYRGEHDILKQKDAGKGKPSNRQIYNFPELVIDTSHSYLFSKPQSYDFKYRNASWLEKVFSKDKSEKLTEEFITDMNLVFFQNDEESITSKHGKVSAIAGESVELHFIDTEGNIRFTETDPREWNFFKYDGIEYSVRNYKKEQFVPVKETYEKVVKEFAEVYTSTTVDTWEKTDGEYKKVSSQEHFFGEVPVVRFYNRDKIESKDSISDLRNIISLVDSYEKMASAIESNLEYNGDPYLILKNFALSEEQEEAFASTRILELIGQDVDVSFLQWDHNVEGYNTMLDRIERLLFVLSFTPDLFAKEGLTSDSGVSLEMKFVGADLKADQKERSFITAFRKRLRLIAKQLENKTNKPYFTNNIFRNIDITFNRSMPRNTAELVEMVSKLNGSVSEETRLKLLPFVSNATDERDKMKREQDLFGEIE